MDIIGRRRFSIGELDPFSPQEWSEICDEAMRGCCPVQSKMRRLSIIREPATAD